MKQKIRRAITDLYAVGNEPSAIALMLALDEADVQAVLRKGTPTVVVVAVASKKASAPGPVASRARTSEYDWGVRKNTQTSVNLFGRDAATITVKGRNPAGL